MLKAKKKKFVPWNTYKTIKNNVAKYYAWYGKLTMYHNAELAPAKQASTFWSLVQCLASWVDTLDVICLAELKD